MNSYQYINTVQGATSIAADSVIPANIYTIDRNGIGVIRTTFTGQDVEATVYSFEWYGENTGPVALPGWYNMKLSESSGGGIKTGLFQVGPVVVVGCVYAFGVFPDVVTYIAQTGDTDTDVRDGLETAINAYSWPDGVTVTAIGTNQYEVVVANESAAFLQRISLSLYKSGYYCTFSLNGGPVKEYLIEANTGIDDFPALPSLESSYLYSTLTLASSGIETLLEEPPYTTNSFDDTAAGTTDITNSPQIGTVPAGKCVYYNSRIYFSDSEPLNSGEYIKMIVI